MCRVPTLRGGTTMPHRNQCDTGGSAVPVRQRFDATTLTALFEPFNRCDAPGVVVAAAIDEAVVLRRAFGMANVGTGVGLDMQTRLRIGSTTKHMTCLAALLLQEASALDIDAPVRRYLPELTGVAGDATLRSLMFHTSGQRCALDISLLTNGLAVPPDGYLLDIQSRQSGVNFAAGERMMYCNGGYHLISRVLERVSAQPFAALLASAIFEPLGMNDTFCLPDDYQIRSHVAASHVPRGDGTYERGIFPSQEILGEGGVVSCVDDMLKWCAHLRGEKSVGAPATWEAMFSSPVFSSGARSDYMMGLKRTRYRGCELIHHAGGVVGGTCQMLCVPAHGIDIVLLSNGAIPSPAALSLRMLDILLADRMSGYPVPTPAKIDSTGDLAGTYREVDGDLVYEIGERGGDMLLGGPLESGAPWLFRRDAPDGGPLEFALESGGDGSFVLRWENAAAPDDGRRLRIAHCGHARAYHRIETPPCLNADAIEALSGEYVSEEADAVATLRPMPPDQRAHDGVGATMVLVMAGRAGECRYDVAPVDVDLFRFSPVGPNAMLAGTIAVVRCRNTGRVTGVSVNTARTRNLRFVKSLSLATRK